MGLLCFCTFMVEMWFFDPVVDGEDGVELGGFRGVKVCPI